MSKSEDTESRTHDSSHDTKLMHIVAHTPRGEGILDCIQCGRCTSSCPMARQTSRYNPRRLMAMITIGLKEKVLSNTPWYCLSCFTCVDKCPQGADVGEVIFAIRNIAAREGHIPPGIKAQGGNIIDTGKISNPTKSILKQRQEMGLPEIEPSDTEELLKILRKTGFDKIIGHK